MRYWHPNIAATQYLMEDATWRHIALYGAYGAGEKNACQFQCFLYHGPDSNLASTVFSDSERVTSHD